MNESTVSLVEHVVGADVSLVRIVGLRRSERGGLVEGESKEDHLFVDKALFSLPEEKETRMLFMAMV